jgi:transposase
LEPIFEAIKEKGLSESNWHVDETGWPVFEEVKEKSNFRWWLWVFSSPSTVLFLLDPSRSAKVISRYFDRPTSGIINCDRYKAYIKFVRLYEGIVLLAFCWAHVRRDFLSLANKYPKDEAWALSWRDRIGTLYHVNSQRTSFAKESKEFVKHDKKLRQLVEGFFKEVSKQLEEKELSSHRKKVLQSLENHRKGLIVFVDYPEISMDNNTAERRLRGPVVGRKNYYGSGSKKMGHFAVIMFSIIQTLLLWKIHPKKWLIWYFSSCAKFGEVPPSIGEYLPWNICERKRKELCLSSSEKFFDSS